MRKKLFTSLIALAAMLTFSPQKVGADVTSPTQEINIYQSRLSSSTIDTTKILYKLETTTDANGNQYIPIDMGYGFAWADKSVGASSTTTKGDYFYWGATTKMTSSPTTTTYCKAVVDTIHEGGELPVEYDAASQIMGKDAQGRIVWRMPSKAEYESLKSNCTESQYAASALPLVYTSKISSSAKIYFVAGGWLQSSATPSTTARTYFWTRTMSWVYSSSRCYCGPSRMIAYSGSPKPTSYVDNINTYNNRTYGTAYQGMNVRGIYYPPFTTHKLTIKAQLETTGTQSSKSYVYVCEEGQTIRVTAKPLSGKYFKQWSDGDTHQTRDFVIGTEDKAVTAIFTATEPPKQHTITFKNYDGSLLQSIAVDDGTMPVYSGSTPNKPATDEVKYIFTGWSPELVEAKEAAEYTAQFSESPLTYTITIPSVDNGTITAADDEHNYKEGDVIENVALNTIITFTAIPSEHYNFGSWTYPLTDQTTNPYTGKLKAYGSTTEISVGATFEIQHFAIATAVNDANMGSVTGAGTYDYEANVTLTATANTGYKFVRWYDDAQGTIGSTRQITVTEAKTYTAIFALESDDQSVMAYQVAAADTTKILYALTPVTKGSITYTPIDLGYGVAWCDRNIGAAKITDKGNWYYWGGVSACETFRSNSSTSSIELGVVSVAQDADFSTTYDAAYMNIGSYWRVPSKSDWQDLVNEFGSSVVTYTNKFDNTQSITIPAYGYVQASTSGQNISGSTKQYYWSRTKGYKGSNSNPPNDRAYFLENGTVSNGAFGFVYYGMPIRPIYQPTFTIYTLTVNVGTQKYVYKCQSGQTITVTAVPDDANGYSFASWTIGETTNTNATLAVTMDGNKTITANFNQVVKHTVTIAKNEDSYGTVSAPSIPNVVDGTAISVAENVLTIGTATVTATPTKANALYTYAFTGWTGIPETEKVTGNMTITANFTATQKEYFELVDTARVGDNFYNILASLVKPEEEEEGINVKYMRTFPEGTTDAPTWNVFSLPFDYPIENDANFLDRVVQLDHATYDEGTDVLTLYFVYQNTYLNANKPYVFYNKGAALVEPVFNNVTIEAQADGSYAKTCTPNGQVYFRNTQVRGSLAANSNIAFLYNNKLYYSGQGNSMRAFRGYFEMEDVRPSGSPAPRRIVMMVDEATGLTSEMEVTSISTKKVIEDGILYIERNGVRYNAQGATIR